MIRRICAWCGKNLQPFEDGVPDNAPISHGMCETCAAKLFDEPTVEIGDFLESLGGPVVTVDSMGRIQAANNSALKMIGKPPDQIFDTPAGNVFNCRHSAEPEGCGHTVHCVACTVRNAFTATLETGEAQQNIPAYLTTYLDGRKFRLEMHISTEKAGKVVMLRIEQLASIEIET